MEMIALILSGLALLAASVCLGLIVRNEKRSKKRNAALVHYADSAAEKRLKQAESYTDASVRVACKNMEQAVTERIEKLEKGIVPDYEQAKAAANAVNDFSQGITNILGFDPMEALKAERTKKEAGDPG